MSLPRIHFGGRKLLSPSCGALLALENALANFRISPLREAADPRRHATHQAQGRANGAKDGPGKRLGAKKSAGQYVVTGNIIFKQRGTHWFPGDNCFMGRDHTIHAKVPGYVKYYRDPARHPKRKFIGIVFERDQTLPQPPNAVRRRRLGMLAYQTPSTVPVQETGDLTSYPNPSAQDAAVHATTVRQQPNEVRQTMTVKSLRYTEGKEPETIETKLTLRPGYQWREANWEIGRAAERSKAAQAVRPFKPRDRWLAWRKRAARAVRNAERRSLGRGGKKSKK